MERALELLQKENAALKGEVARLSAPADVAPAPDASPAVSAAVSPQSPPPAVAVAAPLPVEPWDGAYVGLNVGLAEAEYLYRTSTIGFQTHGRVSGAAFGAQVGQRWQSGNVVAGLELEASIPDLDTEFYDRRLDLTLSGRIKGQIGFALGPVLAYGMFGLQVSQFRYGLDPGGPSGPPPRITNGATTGLTYGFGIATRLTSRLSLEVEAFRTDLAGLAGFLFNAPENRGIALRLNQQIP